VHCSPRNAAVYVFAPSQTARQPPEYDVDVTLALYCSYNFFVEVS